MKNTIQCTAFLVLMFSALGQCGSVGWSQEGPPIAIIDHGVSVREGTGFTIRVETKTSESDDVQIGSFGLRTAHRVDADNVPPGFEIEGSKPNFARPKNRDLTVGFLDNGPRDEDSRKGVFVTTIETKGWQTGRYRFLVTAHNRPAPGAYVGDARTFSIEVQADGKIIIPSVTTESNVAGRDVVLYKEEGVYAPFPSLYGLDDGEVLLSRFSRRPSRKHIDERSYGSLTMLSRDGGLSWQETDRSAPVLPYIQTQRGEWVQPANEGWRRADASERERLEKMGRDVRDVREGRIAYLSPYYRIRRSQDKGATWTQERIRAPEYVRGMYGFFETHSGLVTSTGVRLRAIYGKANGSDHYEVFFLRSADDGRNWDFVRLQPEGPKEIGFGESSLIETASGRLLIVMRTDPAGELWQSFSDDGGETWTSPEKTGMWGYPPHLLSLPAGKLLCTYGYRRAPMGVRASVSEDNGKSWNVDSEFILRGDGRHNGSDLGYPTSVVLNDGTLFTSYYITLEDNITHIAGTQWKLPRDNGESKSAESGAATVR